MTEEREPTDAELTLIDKQDELAELEHQIADMRRTGQCRSNIPLWERRHQQADELRTTISILQGGMQQ